MHFTSNFLKASWPTLKWATFIPSFIRKINHYTHLLTLPTSLSLSWQDFNKSRRGRQLICTAHWSVGWTILVSGYAKLVQCLSLCNHVSYEPGSIGLLRGKAVSMTASWQSVWQPYRHTNMKSSQPDTFLVVSLTTLQTIKWCQAFCCDGCGAVHRTNTQSKGNRLYCDKNYVQVAFTSETQPLI